MRDGRAAGHHISVEAMSWVAGQFEQAIGAADQRVEPLARSTVGEGRAIGRALERQDRLQVPAQLQRDFRSNLVGAVGDRRDEPKLRRERGETIALGLEQGPARFLDPLQHVANALAKDWYAAVGK